MSNSLFPFLPVTDIQAMKLTVLRVPVLTHPDDRQFSELNFAILWDQDRDERVIPAVRCLWYAGMLAPHVCFAGEHKGILTLHADTDGRNPEWLPGGSIAAYESALNQQTRNWADPWPIEVKPLSGRCLDLARMLELGSRIRDKAFSADAAMQVPAAGWFKS